MKHSSIDYGIAKDPILTDRWRYTIYPKLQPGGPSKTESASFYASYMEAEAACKKEIDLQLSEGLLHAQGT
jgi:hypothetical protein